VLEHAAPGSIAVASQTAKEGLSLGTATYFSFETLATLGYRAVVPRSEVARGVAIVEAVAGQLYLAVIIARLVSLYVFDER
jgi:voltage-gated potassium channel